MNELMKTDKMSELKAMCEEGGENAMTLASIFVGSGLFKDVRGVTQAVVKIMAGREIGIGAFASMQAIHLPKDRVMLGYHILGARIKASGKYDYRVMHSDADRCAINFLGADGEVIGESSFTMADAKQAGLPRAGGNWSKYPKVMLFARALSQGQRMHCPDVTHGMPVYTEGDFADGELGRVSRVSVESKTDALNAALSEDDSQEEPQAVEVEVLDDVPDNVSEQDIPGLT